MTWSSNWELFRFSKFNACGPGKPTDSRNILQTTWTIQVPIFNQLNQPLRAIWLNFYMETYIFFLFFWLNAFLTLNVWGCVSMRPQCFNSADSICQVSDMFRLILILVRSQKTVYNGWTIMTFHTWGLKGALKIEG